MGDYIDDMIEGWAKGLKESARPTPKGSLDLPGTKSKATEGKAKRKRRLTKDEVKEVSRRPAKPQPPGEPHKVIPNPNPNPTPSPDPVPTINRDGPPEDWKPPRTLPCGHIQWHDRSGDPDSDAQREARDLGYCCDAERRMNDRAAKHKDVHGIAIRRSPTVHWHVKGLYEPVPERLRRTPGRMTRPGWSGLCCDPETGLYIGLEGNDCRTREDGLRCAVHATKETPTEEA